MAISEEDGGRIHRVDTTWDGVVDGFLGTLVAVFIVATAAFFVPTSLWFEVRAVQIFDSPQGTAPRMVVDRTVHREFLADWTVNVFRVVETGFEPACRAYGVSDYTPENRLPPNLDLDWWTWPTQCNLLAGEYVARTTWTIDVLGLIKREVRATSNPFKITEGASDG